MPRRREVVRKEVKPDTKYNSILCAKFINYLMMNGTKSVAEKTFYGAMEIIEKKMNQPALGILEQAVNNARPLLEVKSRRVGGATYQVPVEVRSGRRLALALRWIISFARERSERTMKDRLAAEIMAAAKSEGATIKKKEDTHKMAEANKAFAHYRW
ncbi:MAG: 30S ribosomal protein S7 [Candidatus Glassbacteria bacterium]